MTPWIGSPKITVELLPKTGDRDDFIIWATGPGDTIYEFPLSITGTILAIWGDRESPKVAQALAERIFTVIGTAKAPPEKGFSFDSYNSASTLQETLNKISSEGIGAYAKGGIDDLFIQQFGNELFKVKEKINNFFSEKYGHDFFRSFEDAFEESEAVQDLNDPPRNNADFLYRVCILSVFIDHFAIRKIDESKDILSLQALKNWLKEKIGEEGGNKLCETFKMIKGLRKQYPIHEHYEVDGSGGRVVRKEITDAKTFFEIKGRDYAHDWKLVTDKFVAALGDIESTLSEDTPQK